MDKQASDLVERLEGQAAVFRRAADYRSRVLSASKAGIIRDRSADNLAEFAETVVAILRASNPMNEGGGGD